MSEQPRIVDPKGREITLTTAQKNGIYRKAKAMRESLTEKMCTRQECSKATPERVDKMLNSEFKARPQMEYYKQSMQAIGADPKDADPERLRRR